MVTACVSGDDVGTGAQSTTDEALQGTITPHAVCNGFEPGLPVPLSKEDEFASCMETCDDHGIAGACSVPCCREATARPGFSGCSQCYIQ